MSGGTDTRSGRRGGRRPRAHPDAVRGRVRPKDPFELIRWLALSQTDPRKALAELVQNSLDAGARNVVVTRRRGAGAPHLRIADDGEGVLPDLPRPEALKYVATHIGHSRKRNLSPEERYRLLTQGQYGIGLLGFWSLGERLEMRSWVHGQAAYRLVLYRDRPSYLIEPLQERLDLDECRTEIRVDALHRAVVSAVAPRRAADYLAIELRGQLLARGARIRIDDRGGRGRAEPIEVRPGEFSGDRVGLPESLAVDGYDAATVEIHVDDAARAGGRGIALYSAGTLVAERLADLGISGFDGQPWCDPRLTGLVDFPGLAVAPGSRRGVLADDAGLALASALRAIEPRLVAALEAADRERDARIDRHVVKNLRRAFRNLPRYRPKYALLPVEPGTETGDDGDDGRGVASASGTAATGASRSRRVSGPTLDLLPPGPLEEVRLRPAVVRGGVEQLVRLRARGVDGKGATVDGSVSFTWTLSGDVGRLETAGVDGREALLFAGDRPSTGVLRVHAACGEVERAAEFPVEVLAEWGQGSADRGVPDPVLVERPDATWRSRTDDRGRWEINTAHGDYRAASESAARKQRYLTMLLAKEIVLRSPGKPDLDAALEQLVEIAAFADRSAGGRD